MQPNNSNGKPKALHPCAWARWIPLRGAPKAVILGLATFADRDGVCFPSIEKLAIASGANPKTVRYSLRKLASGGWLRIENRWAKSGRDTSCLYTLNLAKVSHMPTEEEPARFLPGFRRGEGEGEGEGGMVPPSVGHGTRLGGSGTRLEGGLVPATEGGMVPAEVSETKSHNNSQREGGEEHTPRARDGALPPSYTVDSDNGSEPKAEPVKPGSFRSWEASMRESLASKGRAA